MSEMMLRVFMAVIISAIAMTSYLVYAARHYGEGGQS